MLYVAGNGPDVGAARQGDGTALSVTFVNLSRTSSPALTAPTHATPAIEPEPDKGTATQTNQAGQTAAKLSQVLAETGELSSPLLHPHEQVSSTTKMSAASAATAAISNASGDDRLAAYHAELRAAIRRKWRTLTERPFPSGCDLQMTLAVGGAVNATSASGCALATEVRLQLEAAALMAQPLPYAGYEAVFSPELQLEL